jgi:DNA-binding transcriptional ArsR family regulator
MVQHQASLDTTFAALADPTRRAILARLVERDFAVGELAEPFDMSLPAVSKHLRVLERAGLVRRDKISRVVRCRLQAAPMQDAARWLDKYERFWNEKLDALDRYFAAQESARDTTPSRPRASSKRGPTRKR